MNCDLCGINCTQKYIDGKVQTGPWANMCLSCHDANGCGLGLGKGQVIVNGKVQEEKKCK